MTPQLEARPSRWPIIIVVVAMVVLAVTLVIGVHYSHTGGSSSTVVKQTAVDTLEATVDMSGYAYQPADLSVPRGATVTWVNDDKVAHTATEKEHSTWDTQVVHEGNSVSIKFDIPGAYAYYCTIHPYMTGLLTVR